MHQLFKFPSQMLFVRGFNLCPPDINDGGWGKHTCPGTSALLVPGILGISINL